VVEANFYYFACLKVKTKCRAKLRAII